jgi:hypothetical protein
MANVVKMDGVSAALLIAWNHSYIMRKAGKSIFRPAGVWAANRLRLAQRYGSRRTKATLRREMRGGYEPIALVFRLREAGFRV